jgi:hypothetical protein
MRSKRAKELRQQAIEMCQRNNTPNAVEKTYKALKNIYKKLKGHK